MLLELEAGRRIDFVVGRLTELARHGMPLPMNRVETTSFPTVRRPRPPHDAGRPAPGSPVGTLFLMTTGVRRRMGVEERRQQLIGVALELFSHRSPDEVSIDEIAAAAGISRPLVYHYFPGKQSLYEAALRRAADELAARFLEPREGPLGARLLRVMGRFFDFVDDHGPGFAALMRGGPAVGSSTANAMVDGVRQAACEQILAHLGVEEPPARLELVVRSWVSLAESTALMWLDGRHIPRAELELQLVHDFAALAAVSAAYNEEMAGVVLRVLAQEPADGPFGDLLVRLSSLAPAVPAVPPQRLR